MQRCIISDVRDLRLHYRRANHPCCRRAIRRRSCLTICRHPSRWRDDRSYPKSCRSTDGRCSCRSTDGRCSCRSTCRLPDGCRLTDG